MSIEKEYSTYSFSWGEYMGEITNGQIQGNGKAIFKNLDIYDGQWKNGKMSGKGIYKFWDKEKDKYTQVYEGEFKEGVRDGFGEMTYSNRDKYVGVWQNDFRTGEGICWFADGSIFHGIWKFDTMIRGVFRRNNGEFYDGELKDGLFHGYGKIFYTNGNWFEGVFKKGYPSKGKFFKIDGTIHEIEDGIR